MRCGIRPPLTPRIIGGHVSIQNSWPWQCGIVSLRGNLICGCSVAARDWIITAAHCKYVYVLHSASLSLGDFTFWLRLSLSLNFGLSTYLSPKVKWFRWAKTWRLTRIVWLEWRRREQTNRSTVTCSRAKKNSSTQLARLHAIQCTFLCIVNTVHFVIIFRC